MTLYELQKILSITAPFFCSLSEGLKKGTLPGGAIGLSMGVFSAVVAERGVTMIWSRMIRHQDRLKQSWAFELISSLAMFAAMSLPIILGVFGMLFTHWLLRHV